MNLLVQTPLFGFLLTLTAYYVSVWVQNRLKTQLTNPLIISVSLVIIILKILNISLDTYANGAALIGFFLAPATITLGLSVYRHLENLKRYWLVVLAGSTVGAAVSISTILIGARIFSLEPLLRQSLIPKSVTNAIAIEISPLIGGIPSLTVLAVLFTGLTGILLIPLMVRLFCRDNEVAQGLAIGTSTHLIGTSKALEIGSIQGAMSSIAICTTGLATVVLVLVLQL
jgi:putative effector of murein hydrolase